MKSVATNDKSQVQVIARAAAILRALENEALGLSLGQIAERVGLARSTVQRIIAALDVEKLVIQASPTGRMRLGPTILRLASSVRTDFAALARPLLVELSKQLGETVDLSIIKKDQAVFIDQVTGPHRLRTVSVVGESYPLYCTANGKAYLAELDDEQIALLMGRKYHRRTKQTLTTFAQLIADLRSARQTGVAYDREEHASGICTVAVAAQDPFGSIFALSVPVPTQRFALLKGEIEQALMEISAELKSEFAPN